MAKRENISISFTPQQAEFLAACVASGRYQSTSEVVREAVRLLAERHERRRTEIERVRALIKEGADELARGEEIDGGTVFRELDDMLAEMAARERQQAS